MSMNINADPDQLAGLFPAILGKGPWPKLAKNDQHNIKIGRNHNKGCKIYPENQIILDCVMSSIPLNKLKYLSIILIWVIVSHK